MLHRAGAGQLLLGASLALGALACNGDRFLAPTEAAPKAPSHAELPVPPDAPVIFLHYDYMESTDPAHPHSHAPDPEAIQLVVDAFRRQGLILHIDPQHTAIPDHEVIHFGPCDFRDDVNFYDLKARYFHPRGNQAWHYAIFAHHVATFCPGEPYESEFSTGLAELPGYNVVVSLYHFLVEQEACAGAHYFTAERCRRIEAGTFMHELGHNFRLCHGGPSLPKSDPPYFSCDPENWKPNYLSVMNYRFQLIGVPFAAAPGSTEPAGFRIDYSDLTLPSLDENHLDERAGLGGPPADRDISIEDVFSPDCTTSCFGFVPTAGPIDWNGDGAIEPDVRASLNPMNELGFGDIQLRYSILDGFDDWAWVHAWLNTPTYFRGLVKAERVEP